MSVCEYMGTVRKAPDTTCPPEPLVDVLCTFNDGSEPKIVARSWMYHDGSWAYEEIYGKITHWMPMPEPADD